MTKANEMSRKTDRRTVSVQRKNGKIWISACTGGPPAQMAFDVKTELDAKVKGFEKYDVFYKTPARLEREIPNTGTGG